MKNTDLIAVGEREFKVGDLVVATQQHTGNCVFECEEWMVGLGEYIRHATPAEIKAGHRIDRTLTSDSDDVVDISYHVSPLTKVECHHWWCNVDSLGATKHHYVCVYCGEKKTEEFGVEHGAE